MPNRGPLTGRDIAALDFAYARIIGETLGRFNRGERDVTPTMDQDEMLDWAFELADKFVSRSNGSWAERERGDALKRPSRREHSL